MADSVVESLVLDLVDWVGQRERSYEEVMAAWRTSCPKLPVWEEANERGLVKREEVKGKTVVRLTEAGLGLMKRRAGSKSTLALERVDPA